MKEFWSFVKISKSGDVEDAEFDRIIAIAALNNLPWVTFELRCDSRPKGKRVNWNMVAEWDIKNGRLMLHNLFKDNPSERNGPDDITTFDIGSKKDLLKFCLQNRANKSIRATFTETDPRDDVPF